MNKQRGLEEEVAGVESPAEHPCVQWKLSATPTTTKTTAKYVTNRNVLVPVVCSVLSMPPTRPSMRYLTPYDSDNSTNCQFHCIEEASWLACTSLLPHPHFLRCCYYYFHCCIFSLQFPKYRRRITLPKFLRLRGQPNPLCG